MGTRFTRVTVVGDARQVDVSLPADEPLASQLPTLLRMLSVPTEQAPVRWVLSNPETGAISRDRSLDDAGVLDGTVLHLTPAAVAALSPFVDDVESATAEAVTSIAPAWARQARRSGVAVLLAAALALAVAVCSVAASPVGWVGAAVTAAVALAIGAVVREPAGSAVAIVAAPAAAVVGLGLLDALGVAPAASGAASPGSGAVVALVSGVGHGSALPLAVAAGGLGLLGAGLARRWSGLRVAGLTAVVIGGAATVATWAGLQADRTAGLVVLLAVIGVGLAGQLALGGAGLVNLMRFDEEGRRVPREAVRRAAARGQGAATGLVWCAALLAGAALWVLAQAPGSGAPEWIGRVVAAVGALIFAVRSRMFTRVRQVLPMLLAAVAGACALALAAPGWWGMGGRAASLVGLALLAVIVVVLFATGLSALPDVPKARMRRVLDLLDSLSVLALVPLLVLLFAVIPAVHRWLG